MNRKSKDQLRMPILEEVVDALCMPKSYEAVWHKPGGNNHMPSAEDLAGLVRCLRLVLFPGYFGGSSVILESMRYHLSANLDSIYRTLGEQILRGMCFGCEENKKVSRCEDCERAAYENSMRFIASLPKIRHLLSTDVRAAYEGDPAAKTPAETILCYPSINVMINHRIAHELYKLDVLLVPRIISEMAHSATGIDIHPGAQIGEEFFIDHGTGVVIGETAIIGKGCRLYQGVTLGALSFPKDEDGTLTKGIPRHPILEDNVTVYAGATILGRITIGSGSVIGGNTWITQAVPAGSKVLQSHYTKEK